MGFCVPLKGRNLFKSFWSDNADSSNRDAAMPEAAQADIKLGIIVFRVAGCSQFFPREIFETVATIARARLNVR